MCSTAILTCGIDPVTGWFRDGRCETAPNDAGSHTICAVVSEELLEHQKTIGNDLTSSCLATIFQNSRLETAGVTARNWLRAHKDGAAPAVVLSATHEMALEIVPIETWRLYAVDVLDNPGELT